MIKTHGLTRWYIDMTIIHFLNAKGLIRLQKADTQQQVANHSFIANVHNMAIIIVLY